MLPNPALQPPRQYSLHWLAQAAHRGLLAPDLAVPVMTDSVTLHGNPRCPSANKTHLATLVLSVVKVGDLVGEDLCGCVVALDARQYGPLADVLAEAHAALVWCNLAELAVTTTPPGAQRSQELGAPSPWVALWQPTFAVALLELCGTFFCPDPLVPQVAELEANLASIGQQRPTAADRDAVSAAARRRLRDMHGQEDGLEETSFHFRRALDSRLCAVALDVVPAFLNADDSADDTADVDLWMLAPAPNNWDSVHVGDDRLLGRLVLASYAVDGGNLGTAPFYAWSVDTWDSTGVTCMEAPMDTPLQVLRVPASVVVAVEELQAEPLALFITDDPDVTVDDIRVAVAAATATTDPDTRATPDWATLVAAARAATTA